MNAVEPDPGRTTARSTGRTPSTEVERTIIDAAERLLEADGPTALTVRGIAAAAGVAPMSVYNHLGGKEGVLDALLVRGFDALTAVFAEIAGEDPFEDLAESGRRYRAFARANPARYQLMFEPSHDGYEPSAEVHVHATACFKSLETLVRRAISSGALAPGDCTEIAQALWSSVHGAISLELHGLGFCSDNEANQQFSSDALLNGLRQR